MRFAWLLLLAGCSSEPASEDGPDASLSDTGSDVVTTMPDSPVEVAADGPPVLGPAGPRFIGRFDDAHQSSWSHSAIALRFTGTDVSVTLSGASVMYEVVLDGTR